MQYISRLDEQRPLADVGGKAFHLRSILALGFPVPAGFVVTAPAFQAFLDQNQLRVRISQFLATPDFTQPDALRSASLAIRELILAEKVPSEVTEELASNLPDFGSGVKVAVRSSAVGEDSSSDSFAGQLDSILHIEPRLDAILEALKSCWASYWSDRVLHYQQNRRIELRGMGVIVQEQIAGAYSGVLFTQHPTTGRQSMLLEYCAGLGDQLVSGNVTPASLVISRETKTADENADLSKAQIAQLTAFGIALENAFGWPQDIEWTVTAAGRVYLLQSRAITTFLKPKLAETPTKTQVVWSNANVNENYPDPICPLLFSIASRGYYHYFRNLGLALGIAPRRVRAMEQPLREIVGWHGARLYYNLTNIDAVLRAAPFGDLLAEAFANFVGAERVTAADSPLTWKELSGNRLVQGWEVAVIAIRSLWQFAFLRRRVARFERTVDQFAQRTQPQQLASHSRNELLDDLHGFLDIRCHRWLDASLADAAAMLSYGLLKRLLNREFSAEGEAALHNSLLKGLRDVVSGVPAARLWELSRQVRSDERLRALFESEDSAHIWQQLSADPECSAFHHQAKSFLDEWGFRCSGELMLTVPSFQERPAAVIEILQAYAKLDGESPAQRLERQEAERKTESARIFVQLRRRWIAWYVPWPRQSFVARFLLAWTQQAILCRERARLKQALLYSRLRRIALAIGEHLVTRQILLQRDDVFFLTTQELEDVLASEEPSHVELRDLVANRQATQRELTRTKPPDFFSLPAGVSWQPAADGDTVADVQLNGENVLHGIGVCGGTATATAVVLSDVTELAQLKQGNILVTRQTDPGWGPVFPLIQALVIERGGMLSHGAILAREYGLPTVVGIANATERIRAGQTVTVDGDRGRVELH